MKKTAILGTTLIDILFNSPTSLDHYCNKGSISTSIGGSMCNVARKLNQLGLSLPFYTILGNDFYKDNIISVFNQEGIDLHAHFVDEATPLFIQLNESIRACSINDSFIIKEFNDPDCLLITDNQNCIQPNTIFSGSIPTFDTLEGLIINEMEAKTYHEDLNQALIDLHQNQRCKFVIITLADQGYMWAYQNEFHSKHIHSSLPGNFLGSGDAFLAGFLFGYLQDQPFTRCLELAENAAMNHIKQ